jgi:hypothetical protein
MMRAWSSTSARAPATAPPRSRAVYPAPGGALVLADTAPDDLHAYRGFYEPYREAWARFDPDTMLRETGFAAITAHHVPRPLWARVVRKLD